MKLTTTLLASFLLSSCPLTVTDIKAQDIGLAKELYTHNLKPRALELFIEVLHSSKSTANVRAEALYYMGKISYEDGRLSAALGDWERLAKDYPSTPKAIEIKGRLPQIREGLVRVTDASITSAVAQSYIENGDFWSDAKRVFEIDLYSLPKVELAIQWYDKAISEFPGSNAAELAYNRKLFAILGWSTSESPYFYGLRGWRDSSKYLPILLETFQDFEIAFPFSPYLQAWRYQIAQFYRNKNDLDNARKWLNRVIEAAGGQPTFYAETAKARLEKLDKER